METRKRTPINYKTPFAKIESFISQEDGLTTAHVEFKKNIQNSRTEAEDLVSEYLEQKNIDFEFLSCKSFQPRNLFKWCIFFKIKND
jgi:hypothetical protein